jgi:hypothetical protein
MDGRDRHFRHVVSWRTLVPVFVVAFLAMGFVATVPFALAQADDHCPDDEEGGDAGPGAPPGAVNGSTGSITLDGFTVSWDGTEITLETLSEFCVKGRISGNTGVIYRRAGVWTTKQLGLEGPQGQAQEVSYLILYDVYPPKTSPSPGTTTPPGTTTTPPGTTTTPPGTTTTPPGTTPPLGGGGTTSSPSVLAGGGTNTGSPSPLAFTGSDGVPWLIGAGLLLLLIGTLALRLGSKPARPTDRSA